MIEKTICVGRDDLLITRNIADITGKLVGFQSRLLLLCGNKTVNAKSLMGVATMHLEKGMTVNAVADGADEAQAMDTLVALLG